MSLLAIGAFTGVALLALIAAYLRAYSLGYRDGKDDGFVDGHSAGWRDYGLEEIKKRDRRTAERAERFMHREVK